MSGDLSIEQTKHLYNILNKGLDDIHDEQTRPSPSISKEHFYNRSNSHNASDSPFHTTDFTEAKVLKTELNSLQEKLALLEAKLSSPKSPPFPDFNRSEHRGRSPFRSFRSSASSDKLLSSIERSEKEIQMLERSITPSPSRKPIVGLHKQLENLKAELVEERRINSRLERENESLRKKLVHREDLQSKLVNLQEDLDALICSYERSESIRSKQKLLIEQLKGEVQGISKDCAIVNKTPSFPSRPASKKKKKTAKKPSNGLKNTRKKVI